MWGADGERLREREEGPEERFGERSGGGRPIRAHRGHREEHLIPPGDVYSVMSQRSAWVRCAWQKRLNAGVVFLCSV